MNSDHLYDWRFKYAPEPYEGVWHLEHRVVATVCEWVVAASGSDRAVGAAFRLLSGACDRHV